MGLSVLERGRTVATFRHIHVEMMETLACWTPTSPEMEVKLMLGEHIWDVAQNADALGKRTRELRLPLQHSIKPVDLYAELLADVRNEKDTARRLGSFYDVLLPGLAARYRAYLEQTDTLMDEPTVRILQQMQDVQSKMMKQCQALRAEFPALGNVDRGWVNDLAKRESGIKTIVA
jgi:hypothetical protein